MSEDHSASARVAVNVAFVHTTLCVSRIRNSYSSSVNTGNFNYGLTQNKRKYSVGLLWSVIRVVCHEGVLSLGWSVIRMVSHQTHPIRVVSHQTHPIRVVSHQTHPIRVVSHEGAFSLRWSVIRLVSHQTHLIRVVSHQASHHCGLSSDPSQGGLSSDPSQGGLSSDPSQGGLSSDPSLRMVSHLTHLSVSLIRPISEWFFF